MNNRHNVYFGGAAGTGKTTLLKSIIKEHSLDKRIAVVCPTQSAEYGTFRRDLRCARRNFFCSLLSILNSLLKISGVQVPCSAHQCPTGLATGLFLDVSKPSVSLSTIHSFLGIGQGKGPNDFLVKLALENEANVAKIRNQQMLVL